MALIKFGGGVVGMAGSIAGNVFARNRYGSYARARTKPVNPNSSRQQAIRSAIAYLTQRWNGDLTAAQRDAWGSYGDAVQMKNRLGENVNLSGFNHYIRSNAIIKQQSLTVVDDGPTTLSLPDQDSTFAIAATADDQKIAITFDEDLAWVDEDEAFLFIFCGSPQLATRNFFAGPWRFAGKIDGDSVTAPTSPTEIDSPFTLTTGQKIWCYARIARADGRISEPFRDDAIVAAS